MIRVVLAVVLAAALLGVALPVVDDARRDHSETVVSTEFQRVERAAANLLDVDDPADDGARRVVTVRLPAKSWADAGVDAVTLGESPNGSGGRLTWTVAGGSRSVRYLTAIPLQTPDGAALSLTEPGRHRLVLSLDGNRSDPVVTVRRFTSDEGASGAYATVATDPERRRGRRLHV